MTHFKGVIVQAFGRFWIRASLTCTGVGLVVSITSGTSKYDFILIAGMCGLFLLFVYALIHTAVASVRAVGNGMDALSRGIPSPQEIELELRRLGHTPTLSDVAAVQQMLINQRNSALGGAALGIGAIYLLGHDGRL